MFKPIFCYLMIDFCVKRMTRFSLRDKRFFEIIEVEITRIDYKNSCLFLNHPYYTIPKRFGFVSSILIDLSAPITTKSRDTTVEIIEVEITRIDYKNS